MDSTQDQALSQLLTQGISGDSAAYTDFLKQISVVLRRFLSSRMPLDLVEDVVQDTLVAIHKARHTYRSENPVGPWAYTICRHRMIDFMRKYRRIQNRETPIPEGFEFKAPEEALKTTDKLDSILTALKHLPEKQRTVIEMMKVQGMTVKETSAKTGLSESAVKVNAFRGYQTLRRTLQLETDGNT